MPQIPETPRRFADLDLLKRLDSYAQGEVDWDAINPPGDQVKQECASLHARLLDLSRVVSNLLDKINAREMESFTMHDRNHALKVAHIMWHILTEERRQRLTPPEIGLLVGAALLHDLGMFLSAEKRNNLLDPESELWTLLEIDPKQKGRFDALRQSERTEENETQRQRIQRKIAEAEESLLCRYLREGHADPERYRSILDDLRLANQSDPIKIPNVDVCFSFDGDSFLKKLIDICVSHYESATELVVDDPHQQGKKRFVEDYPVGHAKADLLMVAAALRLADILDFDRERTPSVLFHYYLPGGPVSEDDRSGIEWSKHLSVSHWEVHSESIVYKCRCSNHIVHHAIVEFCEDIRSEISETKVAFTDTLKNDWPFALPDIVKPDITEEGYTYMPYKFELDDERVYELLMGGAIYENPLDAVRELVQNAVDACKLRDALTQYTNASMEPSRANRIFVEYQESDEIYDHPRLMVRDDGTGMDKIVIDRWFLKVGNSYYNSSEFNRYRAQLREKDLDFAPVSEFGIGFLSSFLLSDRVVVKTAMWQSLRSDTRKRILDIHGPTRLIKLIDEENTGLGAFNGTAITLHLCRGGQEDKSHAPNFESISDYLRNVCLDLPYDLHLKHLKADGAVESIIKPLRPIAPIPDTFREISVRIPIADEENGLSGEIALFPPDKAGQIQWNQRSRLVLERGEGGYDDLDRFSHLVRGGFRIGSIPGILSSHFGVIKVNWNSNATKRFALTDISRTRIGEEDQLAASVLRTCHTWIREHINELPQGFVHRLDFRHDTAFNPYQILDGMNCLELYHIARNGFPSAIRQSDSWENSLKDWEIGRSGAIRASFAGFYLEALREYVLPLITKRHFQIDSGNYTREFLNSPRHNWREILGESVVDSQTKPKWNLYAEFRGECSNYLLSFAERAINQACRSQIRLSLEESEIAMFERYVETSGFRDYIITAELLSVLSKLREEFGEKTIGMGTNSRIKFADLKLGSE